MERHILPFRSAPQRSAESGYEFDEQQFTPTVDELDTYVRDVSVGYERMRNRRLVIAGLARDVAGVLPKTIARIERQGRFFSDYRVVIYENDSSDDTPELLAAWARRNPRVISVSETRREPVNKPSRCLDRARRMAFYRSQCQQVIERECASFDNVMLIDTDLDGGWSYDGVAHTFAHDSWDFVAANGIIFRRRWLQPNSFVQYDAWAYRDDADFTALTTKQVNYIRYCRGEQMRPIFSAFGGVGLYRMPAYLAGHYEGSDVEHVTFHQSLHRQGYCRTFLNPNLFAVYGRKHRTLDRIAAPVVRGLDLIMLRKPTVWQYGRSVREDVARHDEHRRAA